MALIRDIYAGRGSVDEHRDRAQELYGAHWARELHEAAEKAGWIKDPETRLNKVLQHTLPTARKGREDKEKFEELVGGGTAALVGAGILRRAGPGAKTGQPKRSAKGTAKPVIPQKPLDFFDPKREAQKIEGHGAWLNSAEGKRLLKKRQNRVAITPSESYLWQNMKPAKPIGGRPRRTNGLSGKKERIFEWDSNINHLGEIEVYNGSGKHLGVVDPVTGRWIKGPEPGRRTPVALEWHGEDDQTRSA